MEACRRSTTYSAVVTFFSITLEEATILNGPSIVDFRLSSSAERLFVFLLPRDKKAVCLNWGLLGVCFDLFAKRVDPND